MIRLATYEDLPVLGRMGEEFFNASGHGDHTEYSPDDMEETFKQVIDSGGLLTDGEHGMIGILVFPIYYNKDFLFSQELFWWVDECKRGTGLAIRLMKAAEELAKEKGAKAMTMISVSFLGESVDNMYEKMGYKKCETSFMRVL